MLKLVRQFALVAALTGLFGAFLIAATGPAEASPPPAATFNPNLLLQGSGSAAEPSIRTDQFGQSFVIAPIGVPAGCKAFRVRHDGSASSFLGFPDSTAGGGDCDWALGPQETAPTIMPPASDNVLAYSSLTLANITVGKSDDGGNSFGPPNPGASQVAGDDRMWMAADPKLNGLGFADIFMNYHDVNIGNIQLSVSTDGGQTYAQNGPIINDTSTDPLNPAAPAPGQWEVIGLSPGNFIGNIVARRDSTGTLKLYSIFATADSATDNTCQGAPTNMTANYNRVYEAVGTVTDAPGTGTPAAISWHNYEIYHGPGTVYSTGCTVVNNGANYGKLFPITAVDSAGKVYAFWSDGKHIDYKTDTTGTGWNSATAPGQIANPTDVNTVLMPWAEAGKSGIVDLVFYGAQGPTAGDNDNLANTWNVYMAQTVDGGSTWGVFKASDHTIHTGGICISGLGCTLNGGDRTLLDFFQVSIDPTNGAADIAYADDSATPGSSSLYFTRQCTGASATTGLALVNDCKAPVPPPPPPPGKTCPGPQIVDFTNDAPNTFPAGDGSNIDALDIENATYSTDILGDLEITLTIKNLSVPPPPANIDGGYWAVYFDFNSVTYIVQASGGPASPAPVTYTAGQDDGNQADAAFNNTPITGTFNPGANGTIVFTVPRTAVGNPANGDLLTNLFADTHASALPPAIAGGVYYTAAADRAPDTNFSKDVNGQPITYKVGDPCTPPPPPSTPASLTLAPKTETDTVGTQASETATVKDLSGDPVPNIVVRFTVTGANPGTFTETTDQFGQAKITYTGQNVGTDNIAAYADTDNSNTQDTGEPGDTATKTWTTPISTPCAVKITNGGWIKADNGDRANFGGNAEATSNGSLKGQEEFQDKGANVSVHSINVTSVTCPSPTQARIFGTATNNGSGTYNFQINVQDGATTNQPDMYGMTLSGTSPIYESGEHVLGGGQIDIHKN
jgi:hypothetical protein